MSEHPVAHDLPIAADLVTIKVERWADFKAEGKSLFEAHWKELATYPDIPLWIDDTQYEFLERRGHLMIVTLRVEDRLCGYAVFMIGANPHYATSLQAKEDVIYITPTARRLGLGRNLLRQTEVLLRQAGVQVVAHAVKRTHPALGELLQAEGYQPIEMVYVKRLDGQS